MKYRSLMLCMLFMAILVCGCAADNRGTLPSTKFVAIKLIVRDSGTLVSGTIPMIEGAQPPIAFFDHPEWYNSSNYPYDYPPKNDSLKILVGVIDISESPLRLTTHLDRVIGIYDLPYTIQPGLTITSVDDIGNVELSFEGVRSPGSGAHYANESIHLSTGAVWTSPAVSGRLENMTIKFPGVGGTDYPITMSFVRSYEVDYQGVFPK